MARGIRPALVAVLALALGACGQDDGPAAPEDETATGDTDTGTAVVTDYTDPVQLLDAHVRFSERRLLDPYMALLEPAESGRSGDDLPDVPQPTGFRFYFRPDRASAFPWLPGASWGIGDERKMFGNMCDAEFTGDAPPVDSIEFGYDILVRDEPSPGVHLLVVDVVITTMTGPNDGWRSDTRFEITMATQSDGHLRIRSIREVQKLAPPGRAVAESTWGEVKAQYL